ncbi:MAG TPA: protein kinase [Verrucomicrobiae bacterium]|jgi:eukaryotic-like serine/threonine-protein kinase|nr:protein kinase [Verrucomicrobiae bacterium]
MGLTSGTKLGPYEIQSPLGAGGMGEVYRAKDTRLDRTVAIKILPQHLSTDPDLRQRFDREARAISSLNHPRICTLYDVGHQDGIDFLVMEYLEGETLAQRLRKGRLSIKEALRIGIEICEALEKAHASGIIHRDLKPGNIMLTASGAKLMDFGLAKVSAASVGSAASAPLLSAAQTLSEASPLSPLTTAGAVVGTIQYMAPEQIQGKEADTRSDLFALGTVLYEMVTGLRPFEGKSQISVAGAILEKDPEPISKIQPLTPAVFEHVVNTCLAKNPEDRFQSAHDVKLELKWIEENPSQVAQAETAVKRRSQFLPWTIAAAAILFCIGGGWFLLSRTVPQTRYHMVTFREGTLQNARFSHDGQTIVFSGQWEGEQPQVSTTRVGSPESRPLGIPSATVAAVSPSDELAAIEGCEAVFILDCGGVLATVSLAGGSPRPIADHVAYADWSPDSKEVAIVVDDANDARLEFPPGHVLYRQNSGWLGHPRFSPDGTLIAFENHPVDSDDGTVDVVDLKGNRRSVSGGWLSIEGLAWRPDGKEIWFAATANTAGWADAIHAVSLSGKERIVLRFPWLRLLDISRDGRVLIAHQNWRRKMVGLFNGDSAEHPYSWLDDSNPTAIADDGRSLTFAETGELYYIENDGQAYYRKTDGSPAVSLGSGFAIISPDGKSILTYGRRKKLTLQPVGLGEQKELPTPGITAFAHASFSGDGQKIAYEGLAAGKEWNVYTQKLDGTPPTLIAPRGKDAFPVLSADGSTLAITDSGKGILLYHGNNNQPEELKGSLPFEHPVRFVNKDRSLLVAKVTGIGSDVTLIDLAGGHRQLWKHVPSRFYGSGAVVAVTPDLKYYAYGIPDYSTDLYLVENLR